MGCVQCYNQVQWQSRGQNPALLIPCPMLLSLGRIVSLGKVWHFSVRRKLRGHMALLGSFHPRYCSNPRRGRLLEAEEAKGPGSPGTHPILLRGAMALMFIGNRPGSPWDVVAGALSWGLIQVSSTCCVGFSKPLPLSGNQSPSCNMRGWASGLFQP